MPSSISITQSALLQRLLEITLALSGQRDIARLYDQIIEAARALTHADGGSLYIVREEADQTVLRFEVIRNNTLGQAFGGASGSAIQFAPIPTTLPNGEANLHNVCAYVYHKRQLINIDDAYTAKEFDFSGTRAFDKTTGYRSQSMLALPLINHANDVIGVLQLINARNPKTGKTQAFDVSLEPIVRALASSAAITLDNQLLLQSHRDLLDAFIKVIAQAIDAKSSHTSAHCQRVPVLTKMLAQAACEATEGPLKSFSLNEEEWYELHVAAWLHDCGKLSTPDRLLDKATKLNLMLDGIETIKARFAAAMAQERLALALAASLEEQQQIQVRLKALEDDCLFLENANKGGEFMRPEDQERVCQIAEKSWIDHQGRQQPLLTTEEVDLLRISRGTLSASERSAINYHIDVTIQMLEALPFPKQLARVPEYAGGHHERVDGTGFPKGLRKEEMSWPARMMAIADVFEALTARDRPYKEPMRLSQALSILKTMAQTGHLDPDLYTLFIEGGVWKNYAENYLLPMQLDVQSTVLYRL